MHQDLQKFPDKKIPPLPLWLSKHGSSQTRWSAAIFSREKKEGETAVSRQCRFARIHRNFPFPRIERRRSGRKLSAPLLVQCLPHSTTVAESGLVNNSLAGGITSKPKEKERKVPQTESKTSRNGAEQTFAVVCME